MLKEAHSILLVWADIVQVCDVTRGQRIKTTNLTSRLALLLLLSTDPLLLGPLGTTLLLQDDRKHSIKRRWRV